jgi:hypothetical protein
MRSHAAGTRLGTRRQGGAQDINASNSNHVCASPRVDDASLARVRMRCRPGASPWPSCSAAAASMTRLPRRLPAAGVTFRTPHSLTMRSTKRMTRFRRLDLLLRTVGRAVTACSHALEGCSPAEESPVLKRWGRCSRQPLAMLMCSAASPGSPGAVARRSTCLSRAAVDGLPSTALAGRTPRMMIYRRLIKRKLQTQRL